MIIAELPNEIPDDILPAFLGLYFMMTYTVEKEEE